MDRGKEPGLYRPADTPSPEAGEAHHASFVPGCILLAIGAMLVLLLAIGWLI